MTTPAGRIVPGDAVTIETRRSGGPGGQHANTSDTAVRVTIAVDALRLSAHDRTRIGVTRITSSSASSRSQIRNREEALRRALQRLDDLLVEQPVRRPTRPGTAAREKRLHTKRVNSEKKAGRSERFD